MHKIRSTRGFTLIEVIAVLLLIGILAVVAVSRVTDIRSDEVAAANSLRAHLRFAQMQAMNTEISWGVHSDGNGYVLFRDGNTSNTERIPGEGSVTINPPRVTVPLFTISFDQWGRPYDLVADPSGASPIDADATIAVGYNTTIRITPETGFIP